MTFPSSSDLLPSESVARSGLRVRQEIYERYSAPQVDYHRWVLSRIEWRGDERVLDVDSGGGTYYRALQGMVPPDVSYFGIDISAEQLADHPLRGHLAQADAQQLPFASESLDLVMANHMLFRVADPQQAIGEFRRVLKPDGLLIAATNSLHTMPELQALMRRALVLLGAPARTTQQPPLLPHYRFSLENGTRQLARHFYAVVRYDLPTMLVFPDADPVMTFLESTRELREPTLPDGIGWDDLMMVMREQISALLIHFGELVISKLSGVLVASNGGGFIQDFVDRQDGAQN
mgnify:CR=1 FL=1